MNIFIALGIGLLIVWAFIGMTMWVAECLERKLGIESAMSCHLFVMGAELIVIGLIFKVLT